MFDQGENNNNKPALVDLTPSKFRCTIGACPAVFQAANGQFVIIGKKLPSNLEKELESRIGSDEWAIVIEPGLLANLPK
jgi:hypothetical protein